MKYSAVSHKWGEPEFFRTSEISGRCGFENEMRVCDKTGKKVLSDEIVYCAHDQKWYSEDLCTQSEVSQEWGLEENTLTCGETGKKIFYYESVLCCICGKRVAAVETVTSPVSGKVFIKKRGCETLNHEILLPEEAGFCMWQNGFFRRTEIGMCKKSRTTFLKKYLIHDEFFMLFKIQNAINGRKTIDFKNWVSASPDTIRTLYKLPNWDAGFQEENCDVFLYWNPSHETAVFCVRKTQKKWIFSSSYSYFYGFLKFNENVPKIFAFSIILDWQTNIWKHFPM